MARTVTQGAADALPWASLLPPFRRPFARAPPAPECRLMGNDELVQRGVFEVLVEFFHSFPGERGERLRSVHEAREVGAKPGMVKANVRHGARHFPS